MSHRHVFQLPWRFLGDCHPSMITQLVSDRCHSYEISIPILQSEYKLCVRCDVTGLEDRVTYLSNWGGRTRKITHTTSIERLIDL